MKNKRLFRIFSTLCLTLVLASGFAVPAFAQGAAPPPAEDTTNDSNVVVEETEKAPPLTPDGNAALVDDFGGNKQLITVTTKAGNYNEEDPLCQKLKECLLEQFRILHDEKFVRTFFVGGALGVDMWDGEQLLTLRAQTGYKDIKIIVVVPFIGYDSKWPDQSKHRLKKLIQNANDSIVISHSADVSSYKKRNYYMVDHAEYLIGVFDNQKKLRSGTAQTVNYALHQGKVITLIHPDTMEITAPAP